MLRCAIHQLLSSFFKGDVVTLPLSSGKGKSLSEILRDAHSFLSDYPKLFPRYFRVSFVTCQRRKCNLGEELQTYKSFIVQEYSDSHQCD